MAIIIRFGYTSEIVLFAIPAIIATNLPIRIQKSPPPCCSAFHPIINLCVSDRNTSKTNCSSLYCNGFPDFIWFGVFIQFNLECWTLIFFYLHPFHSVLASYCICARFSVFWNNEVIVSNTILISLYFGTNDTVSVVYGQLGIETSADSLYVFLMINIIAHKSSVYYLPWTIYCPVSKNLCIFICSFSSI